MVSRRFGASRGRAFGRLGERGRNLAIGPHQARWPVVRRAVGFRVVASVLLACTASIQPASADESVGLTSARSLSARQISPEATKRLPPQPADRGELMPLHVASVLGWLCGDSTTLDRLSTSTRGCYKLLWTVVPNCVSALQEKAPAAQNVTRDGRMDVVSFRTALRHCLAQQFAGKQQAQGVTTLSIEEGEPDPLAARMGGAVPRSDAASESEAQ